jgi:DNA-binding transcriptional LysR family regulator
MNLELYKFFYHVAKTSNVSKASEQLYVTQPAVSRAIKQLEEELGCLLFFRTSKGVKLT